MTDKPAQAAARYARHLGLPGFGIEAQARLAASHVLVVGAGGLGSPVLAYLAAAGVGTITVMDDDTVAVSNLQRQVLFGGSDLGRPKVDVVEERLRELNPEVRVVTVRARLTEHNATGLVAWADVVVDCSDNFPTRYLVNDACARAGKPCVWASVHEMSGQASVWWAGRGPCYRCLHPLAPPPGVFAACGDTGVLGAVCAVIGGLQATEAIKVLTGVGTPLLGKVSLYDAYTGEWSTTAVNADPGCASCGATARVPSPVAETPDAAWGREIDASEVRRMLADGEAVTLVDCREAGAGGLPTIEGSVTVGLSRALDGDASLETMSGTVVVCCAFGVSSRLLAGALAERGARAFSLRGGLAEWHATQTKPQTQRSTS